MEALERPRRILVMVPAGPPVDSVIAHLQPHLEPGDILIDGGNSFFLDTERRGDALAAAGFHFVGTGVSGGEEGALHGPSIMPGGPRDAWEAMAPIFRAIAAKADDGEPCVAYMGPRGAGHYVKMVHNGIEYGDMQLIAETYDLLRRGAGMSAAEQSAVFAEWNTGELKSYLIEITAAVLAKIDPETGRPLVDVILDEAQQKGTGKWMSQNAFDVGAPIPDDQRRGREPHHLGAEAAARGRQPRPARAGRDLYRGTTASDRRGARRALREQDHVVRAGARAAAHGVEGIRLRHPAGRRREDLARRLHHPREPARRHHGGVPARSRRSSTCCSTAFRDALGTRQAGRGALVVQTAVGLGIPVPAMSASLAYFDAYRSERLPANLTQAQRDYFGAHTYRRVDNDGVFHTEW